MSEMPEPHARLPLIGEAAPHFTAKTTHGTVNFPEDYKGKWVIFFSHPADFTPVCTTEFMTFAKMAPEFKRLNCELIGLSIDSVFSHIAWVRAIKDKAQYKDIRNIEIPFPIIEDLSMDVAIQYGMLQPNASNTQAVRAVFFVDPKGMVRALMFYPMTNGRNIDELKRLLVAMQTSDANKVATPAGWTPGDRVIIPPPTDTDGAEQRMAEAESKGYEAQDWFLTFKKLEDK